MKFRVVVFYDDSLDFDLRDMVRAHLFTNNIIFIKVDLGAPFRTSGRKGHAGLLMTMVRLVPATWDDVDLVYVRDVNSHFLPKEDLLACDYAITHGRKRKLMLTAFIPKGYTRERPCMAMLNFLRPNPILLSECVSC